MGCDRTEGEKFLPRGGASIAPRRTLTRSSEKSRGKRASYIRGGSFPDARTPDGAYAATSRCPPTSRSANPLWYQQKTNSGGAGMSSWPGSDQDVREQKKRPRGYRGLYSLGRAAGITSAAAAEPAPNPSHVKTPLAHCQRRTVNAAYTLRNKVKRVLTLTDSAKLAPMPSGCAGGQGDWR